MRVCPEKRYARGEAIFRVGDPATSLHVIAGGQVKLVTAAPGGHERILAICGPDDFIGEAFLQEAQVYRVDAVALTSATTCPMSREQFLELALRAPTFTLSFAEILTSHLFGCREQLSSAYDPIKQRLVRTLLEQAERFGRPLGSGWCELLTELRHDELASMVSATRVSVSTAFAELRARGFVEGSRGVYRIHVPSLQGSL
jgi:CRP/FNR family cyclic AMP-dependent transcriptional regulator